jgi:hypothetical protein
MFLYFLNLKCQENCLEKVLNSHFSGLFLLLDAGIMKTAWPCLVMARRTGIGFHRAAPPV